MTEEVTTAAVEYIRAARNEGDLIMLPARSIDPSLQWKERSDRWSFLLPFVLAFFLALSDRLKLIQF